MVSAIENHQLSRNKANVLIIGKVIGIWHDVLKKIGKIGEDRIINFEIDRDQSKYKEADYDVVLIFRDQRQPFERTLDQIKEMRQAGSDVILTIGVEQWQQTRACFKAGATDCYQKRPGGNSVQLFREIEYLFRNQPHQTGIR